MSGKTEETSVDETSEHIEAGGRRIAFERLRERTDELELIISGLTAFALLAVPSRLFDAWAQADTHAAGYWEMVLLFGYMIGSGLSYTLAAAFIAHLAVRAYWVGLIGLKASFPQGIRWQSIGTLGPISRAFYRARLPDLMAAIDRADRAASILFAMATLVALLILWSAMLLAVVLALASLLGLISGASERFAVLLPLAVYGVLMTLVTAGTLFDAVVVKRRPDLAGAPRARRFVEGVLRLNSVILPIRMIMPVQLTLHSNTSGRAFAIGLFVILFMAPMIGVSHVLGSRVFSLMGDYQAIDGDTVEYGQISAYYEDQRSAADLLLRYPMIPTDQIASAHLRLFIQHLPGRDNRLLSERCPALAEAGEAIDIAKRGTACVAAMWTVTLDGEPVALDGFLPAERRDLGMRGLQGYLSMAGRQPGRHDLLLIWNADGDETGRIRRREHRIPFWFSPGYELEVD